MLSNNLNMMTFELTKICKTHKIIDFDKEKMSLYPEEAHSRLQVSMVLTVSRTFLTGIQVFFLYELFIWRGRACVTRTHEYFEELVWNLCVKYIISISFLSILPEYNKLWNSL